MLKRTVKLRNLISALTKLGFEERSRRGSHAIYMHSESGVMLTLPLSEEDVRTVIFRAILSQVSGSGVASEEQLLKLL
jgi:predicted RNA binding protein YcfA (HicA-like mRNA interferase family)